MVGLWMYRARHKDGFFFLKDRAPPKLSALPLHYALPIWEGWDRPPFKPHTE